MSASSRRRWSWKAMQPFGAEIETAFGRPLSSDDGVTLRHLLYEHQWLLYGEHVSEIARDGFKRGV